MNVKRIIVRNKSQRGTRYTSIIVQTYNIYNLSNSLLAVCRPGKRQGAAKAIKYMSL
jgi:hypothetical protein